MEGSDQENVREGKKGPGKARANSTHPFWTVSYSPV